MRDIKKIVVHCSDSDVKSHDNIDAIRKWHVEENGWSDIGYHFFLNKKGDLFVGRPCEKVGAHVKGHNLDSLGICVSGRHKFTNEQFKSLRGVIWTLLLIFDLKKENVYMHNELDPNKTCPNFDLKREVLDFIYYD